MSMLPRRILITLLLLAAGLTLTACDPLGLDVGAKADAAREAEGRAIGSGCRHSGRALEDCYGLNAKASKAAVFTGWRDMDTYMRENNIAVVSPAAEHAVESTTATDAKPADSATQPASPEASPARKTTRS